MVLVYYTADNFMSVDTILNGAKDVFGDFFYTRLCGDRWNNWKTYKVN